MIMVTLYVCPLLINTTKFLVVTFALFCLYEVVVFLYFRFVKEGPGSLSKNEFRKRKEHPVVVNPQREEIRKAEIITSTVSSKNKQEDWKSLIDYQGRECSLSNRVADEVEKHEDSSLQEKMQCETKSFLEDLLSVRSEDLDESAGPVAPKVSGEAFDSVSEEASDEVEVSLLEPNEKERKSVESSAKTTKELDEFFSEFGFSNMME